MIIDINTDEFLAYSFKMKFALIDFIARATHDLTEEDYSDFDFKIETKDYYVIITLLYGDECDSSILTWHVYLQEKVNGILKNIQVDFSQEIYEGVLVLIEHRTLWK